MAGSNFMTGLKRAIELCRPNLRHFYRITHKGIVVATYASKDHYWCDVQPTLNDDTINEKAPVIPKVEIPIIWGDAQRGVVCPPKPGTHVAIGYYDGDPDYPYINHIRWHKNMAPDCEVDGFIIQQTPGVYIKIDAESNIIHVTPENRISEIGTNTEEDIGQDKIKKVARDEIEEDGRDRSKQIRRDESGEVLRDRTRNVGRDETIGIERDRTKSVARDEIQSVGQDRTRNVGRDEQTTIGQNRESNIKDSDKVNVTKFRDETYGQQSTTVEADAKREVHGAWIVKVHGSAIVEAGELLEFKADKIHSYCNEWSVFSRDGGNGIMKIYGDVDHTGAYTQRGGDYVNEDNDVTASNISLVDHLHPENDNGGPTDPPAG